MFLTFIGFLTKSQIKSCPTPEPAVSITMVPIPRSLAMIPCLTWTEVTCLYDADLKLSERMPLLFPILLFVMTYFVESLFKAMSPTMTIGPITVIIRKKAMINPRR